MSTCNRLNKLLLILKSIPTIHYRALIQVDAISLDVEGDWNVNLNEARSELSELSNEIDSAMGLIDELLAPEPTREDNRWTP